MSSLAPLSAPASAAHAVDDSTSGESGTARPDYAIESKAFREKVDRMKKAFRDIMEVAKAVLSTEKGGKVAFAEGEVGRKQLNSYVSGFVAELETLGKHFTASVGRGKRTKTKATAGRGAQLRSLFFISDQLVGYLASENYGNGLAAAFIIPSNVGLTAQYQNYNGATSGALDELRSATGFSEDKILEGMRAAEAARAKEEKRAPADIGRDILRTVDVTAALDLVLGRRMATSGILISLFSLIDRVNDLQSRANGQRNHYDDAMVAYFDTYRKSPDPSGNGWLYDTTDGKAADLKNGSNLIPNNTRWVMQRGGALVDVTPTYDSKSGQFLLGKSAISPQKPVEFRSKLEEVGKSAFQRLREKGETKIRRQGGELAVPSFIDYDPEVHKDNDDWGLLHSMYMVLISYFRVPNDVLTVDELEQIKPVPQQRAVVDEAGKAVLGPDGRPAMEIVKDKEGNKVETNPNILEAARVQKYIKDLLTVHRTRVEPARRERHNKKRIQAAASKTTGTGKAKSSKAKPAASNTGLLPLPPAQ